MNYPLRGEIYWIDLDPTIGSEIKKTRPALIISNDQGNKFSNLVIVAPITSSTARVYDFQVKIDLPNIHGKILLNQIRAVDKVRILSKIAEVNDDDMDKVNESIRIALDL